MTIRIGQPIIRVCMNFTLKRLFSIGHVLLLLLLLGGPGHLTAQKRALDSKPSEFLVNDLAGVLQRQEVVRLGQKLRAYALETSTQIAVVTENSLQGEDAFDYSINLAQNWGIGGEQDNGILIYIAIQDRKIAIQTGYGTEGFLPDAMANRIITNIMQPAFRAGRYYEGLDKATQAIMDLGQGEYTNDNPSGRRKATGGIPVFFILLGMIIIMIIIAKLFGGNGDDEDDDDGGYYRGGRYDDPRRRQRRRRRGGGGWIFFPGFGGGGGWNGGGGGSGGSDGFGGFGGGGFGGFGGGDFGGGGAIGDW